MVAWAYVERRGLNPWKSAQSADRFYILLWGIGVCGAPDEYIKLFL
jgi:hypothetical protein